VTIRLDRGVPARAIEDAFHRLDPRLVPTITSVDDLYADQHASALLALRVVGAFSVVAWIVAMAGLYAVISYLVAMRTREIGIRMALGADRRDIRRQILSASGRLVAVGTAVGVGAAYALARTLQSQLFGISPADPVAYLAVVGTVAATAILASWQPAERAARTEPSITLRSE
jgi:ABC-type antimicrobial peptide transport system permease subunit